METATAIKTKTKTGNIEVVIKINGVIFSITEEDKLEPKNFKEVVTSVNADLVTAWKLAQNAKKNL